MPTKTHRRTEPMVPSCMFCPEVSCPLRGQFGHGNVTILSQQERRFECSACGHTFAETKGTPFYRLRTDPVTVVLVLTLLQHGCPMPAIVAAFGFDARTVSSWLARAGQHCQQVHEALVAQGKVDARCVQADEIWVKLWKQRLWMALAMAVPSRLWLGGSVGPRNGSLIQALVLQVRRCVRSLAIVVCVDGLPSYVTAFRRVFVERLPRLGSVGRPRHQRPQGFLMGQVVKQYQGRRMAAVVHRAVVGTVAEITARLQAVGGGQVVNTAYIERLNATFRSRLAGLVRRGRCLAHRPDTLRWGMYLVGTAYNFCDFHESLREATSGDTGRKWRDRTPAMAAGLTTHRWSVEELLRYRVAPPPYRPERKPGRPSAASRVFQWKLRPQRVTPYVTTV